MKGLGVVGSVALIIVVVGMIIALLGFDVVDASHVGVKNRFGVIQGTQTAGMQWTGLFVHVEQYDLRVRKMTIDMQGTESAVDKEGQSVFATIEINYRLKPDNVENVYKRVGKDNIIADILNLDGIVREGFKDTTSKYSALEIVQNRQEVKEKAITQIQSNFPEDYFVLENVIVSNIDFNVNFKNAIEQKKTNEELAKAKEKEVDIQKFEADKKIEQARGEAESKKLQAEAEAYRSVELKKADAEGRLLIAKAEAEALELKRKQLTPLMVQNNLLDKWDGTLPNFLIMGNSGETPNLLLNTPLGMTEQQNTAPIVTGQSISTY